MLLGFEDLHWIDSATQSLYGRMGRAEPARAALTAAIELYRTMDMTFWLPQAEAELTRTA